MICVFIEFTLSAILDTVEAQAKQQKEHRVETLSDSMVTVLNALKSKSLSRQELFAAIGKTNDYRSFKRNIEPLIRDGHIEMTVPGEPSRRLQKYKLSKKGRSVLGGFF